MHEKARESATKVTQVAIRYRAKWSFHVIGQLAVVMFLSENKDKMIIYQVIKEKWDLGTPQVDEDRECGTIICKEHKNESFIAHKIGTFSKYIK